MNFEQLSLDPRILAGVKNAGFHKTTPIQEQAIPVAMDGRDIVAIEPP